MSVLTQGHNTLKFTAHDATMFSLKSEKNSEHQVFIDLFDWIFYKLKLKK